MFKVVWLFRKKRALGNFSIENSFKEVLEAWPNDEKPHWHELGTFSEGIRNRIKIIRETAETNTRILHITGDIHFAALAWPKWRRKRPFVFLTIHDIGFTTEYQGIKGWMLRKFWIHWPLRCIDHLITVSEATKEAVRKEAPWFPVSKITVIPTLVPQHFRPRDSHPHNSKPIALHIGLAENKNLEGHSKALEGLNVHLRIIGEPSESDHTLLKSRGIEYSWAARRTDDEMQAEYANADFLLFASTIEGFGMPIIEANRVGVPVITSQIEPMKSVAGDAAELSDPDNHLSIRNGIQRILEDKNHQKTLIQNGFANAERFSPQKTAQMHREVYNRFIRFF